MKDWFRVHIIYAHVFWLCTSLQSNLLQTVYQEVHSNYEWTMSLNYETYKNIQGTHFMKLYLSHSHGSKLITIAQLKYKPVYDQTFE